MHIFMNLPVSGGNCPKYRHFFGQLTCLFCARALVRTFAQKL